MLIGEAPGYHEDTQGKPFVGDSGKLLSALLADVGIDESSVFITNTVKCRPSGNRTPEPDEVAQCISYLWEEIDRIRPKVILTIGASATKALLNIQQIGSARGKIHEMSFVGADKLGREEEVTIPVVPTWHPAYALRKGGAESQPAEEIKNDLRLALSVLGGQEERKTSYTYIDTAKKLEALTDYLLKLHRTQKLRYGVLSVDIETDDIQKGGSEPKPYALFTNIVSVQIAWDDGKAAIIPLVRKDSPFNTAGGVAFVKQQLEQLLTEVPLIGHNFKFDATCFWTKLGIRVQNVVFDTMLAHHCLWGTTKAHSLDFVESSVLGRPSHKTEMKKALEALPAEERSNANVDLDVLIRYGCGDADSTLQLYPKLADQLIAQTYDWVKPRTGVTYENMYEAFVNLYMRPWQTVLDIEINGVRLDESKLPELCALMEEQLRVQEEIVVNSTYVKKLEQSRISENPKRSKEIKRFTAAAKCGACGTVSLVVPTTVCAACGSHDIKKTRKAVGTGTYKVDETQPETVTKPYSIRSNPDNQLLIYDIMSIPDTSGSRRGKKTKKTSGGSVDKEALQAAFDFCKEENLEKRLEVIKALTEYKKLHKQYSSYVKPIPTFVYRKRGDVSTQVTKNLEPDTGAEKVHPNYKAHSTATGRYSVVDPAIHTNPRGSKIRELFIPTDDDGFFVGGDYSQIEVRLFVVETDDAGLREVFVTGKDPYKHAASKAWGVPLEQVTPDRRQGAKSIVLGLLYGRGAGAIADQIGSTVQEAQKIIDDFMKASPKIKSWIANQHKFVVENGFCYSRLGRIRHFPELSEADSKEIVEHVKRASVNSPIQSLGSDITLNSATRVYSRFIKEGLKSKLFAFVHDAIDADAKGSEILSVLRILRDEMEVYVRDEFPFINVPIVCELELGIDWKNMLKTKLIPEGLQISGSADSVNKTLVRMAKSWKVKPISFETTEEKSGGLSVTTKLAMTPR